MPKFSIISSMKINKQNGAQTFGELICFSHQYAGHTSWPRVWGESEATALWERCGRINTHPVWIQHDSHLQHYPRNYSILHPAATTPQNIKVSHYEWFPERSWETTEVSRLFNSVFTRALCNCSSTQTHQQPFSSSTDVTSRTSQREFGGDRLLLTCREWTGPHDL